MKRARWVLSIALLTGGALNAQLDRGALTGTVSDPTGAVVPNVDVKATNVGTKAVYETKSSQAGSYTLTNLPFGAYEVLFEATSFKKLVRGGVTIGLAEVLRLDATLEVGSVTESVEVRSEIPRLQSETSEVATTIPEREVFDLPMDWGQGGRAASTFAWELVPGTTGGEYGGTVSGSAAFAKETLLDGAPLATTYTGVMSFSNPSVEAIQEFKVQTAGLSAEYGRTQGGVFNYLLKSGTNRVHGSAFGAMRNEDLDANSFANNAQGKPRALDRQQDYAFSFGGPAYIPKVYDGRNRTFFYVAYERFRERNLGFGAPNITEPIADFYKGDFSRLLGPTVATDASGNPVAQGAIYDPKTFQQLPNGQYTGQMFPGNIIPVSRFSKVSQNLNAIGQQYYLPTVLGANGQVALQNNAYFPINIIPIWDQWQFSAKGDENISDKHKLALTYSWTYMPRELANPSNGAGSLWNTTFSDGGPLSDTSYQRQETSLARASHDWIISPRLLNHLTLFFDRTSSPSLTVHSNIDGTKSLGIPNQDTTGYPTINWGTGPLVSLVNPGNPGQSIVSADSIGFIDSVSFSKGRHFMKAGVDVRRMTTNTTSTRGGTITFSATATAIPNASFAGNLTGYSFASYLLGTVASAALTDPVGLGGRNGYYAAFFQDDFKVSKNLTLELGVRWEYQPPFTEVANRLSSWDPTKIDPLSGLPGAYDFAGSCNICTGRNYFGTKDYKGFGPRIGFAYRPFEKWVIRGAYDIIYVPDIFNTLNAEPSGKGNSLAWGGTYSLSTPAVSPWLGLFNWDNGFPTNDYVPASFNTSWADTNSASMIDPRYGLTAYSQQWNLNIQRELMKNLVLDVGYVANKSSRLDEGELERINQLPPSALSQYGTKLGSAVTSAAQAAANGIAYPYPGYSGTVAGALRQYPQILGTGVVTVYGAPLGFSTYNSLQVTVNRQFSHGFTAYGSYVFSKTLTNDNSLAVAANSGPLDYYNLKLEKAVASQDIPQMFRAVVDYELPFGRGKSFGSNIPKSVNAFLGGWSVGAILNYASGAPLGFGGSSPLSSWNGATNRANVAPGDLKATGFSKSAFQILSTASASDTYLNKSEFSNPPSLTLGTGAPRYTQVRGFGANTANIGLQKSLRFHEKYRYQLRADFLNAFNRHTLGGIDTTVTDPLFGQVTSVSGNRTIELGMRLDF